MAKKNKKEKIVLEDVELKPQVIGYTYKKKSNLGRVILIFIIFALAVYYINDISVFINNLVGKETNKNIQNLTQNNKKEDNEDQEENKEIVYNIYSNDLVIVDNNMSFNNFNLNNNILSFSIVNSTDKTLDLSNKKFFMETYSENKTLLERFKVDIKTIKSGSQISYTLDTTKDFYYIVLVEKTIEDYPNITITNDDNGLASITCIKGIETIKYSFKNSELNSIEQTILDNEIDDDYYVRYSAYQKKTASYNNLSGINATFNGSVNGYTAVFNVDLQKVNMSTIEEKYYFSYKEMPKVVKFEMETYGFECNL